ncbi:Dynein assembly factor 3, axonemal [Geranomyces variabilis]|uniref:Dynein assembly factor 3, axonemal n=1 Tax=Geranomyces variabilis TaxID=109894 RepID=A0AAD5XKZ8_9FUNG|nr:Dynein assembly factor 3, axonemal [Geranomyces variabilis]
MNGLGSTTVWALSRAIDLADLFTVHSERDHKSLAVQPPTPDTASPPKDLNFLLVGACDPAHIIKTIARAWRHGIAKINFVTVEAQTTSFARAMILLDALFASPSDAVGIQDRVDTFLELYGNLHLRPQTAAHLSARATHLLALENNDSTDAPIPICPGLSISTSLLKFREKDDIRSTLAFFRADRAPRPLNVTAMWDMRLRSLYAARYDSRAGVVDWDWNMKLKDKAPAIDLGAYSQWRETGMAFPVRDAVASEANRSLATVVAGRWGIFSDVTIGPFCAFGQDCEDKRFVRTQDGKRVIGVQDVARETLRRLLHEWEHGSLLKEQKVIELEENKAGPRVETTVHFVSTAGIPKIARSFPALFDRIFVAAAMGHRVPEVGNLLANKSSASAWDPPTLVVESAKFVLELSKEHIAEYNRRIMGMAQEAGLTPEDKWACPPGTEADHLLFTRTSTQAPTS